MNISKLITLLKGLPEDSEVRINNNKLLIYHDNSFIEIFLNYE